MAKGGKEKVLDPATVEANAAKLVAWERKTRPAIIAAALIPLIGVSTGTENYGWFGALVEIVCWVVFLVDLIVHMRLYPHYLKTGMGRFDLTVVVLTSPWYMLPGFNGGEFVTLLRLARLARVLMITVKTPMLRRTLDRLGKPFMYVGIMTAICAAIVLRAEDHQHGFKPYGASLWWAVVTITTVGYGDLVPESEVGRITATVLMLTGVALLGTVAASLASLFRLEDKADEEAEDDLEEAEAAARAAEAKAAAAGAQVAAVTAAVTTGEPASASGSGAASGSMLPVPPVTAVPDSVSTVPPVPPASAAPSRPVAIPVPVVPVTAVDQAVAVDVAAELRALREEVAALRAELAANPPNP